jgi:two-component system, OmpR family, osmolarity sensor histidine kinase EnvZ
MKPVTTIKLVPRTLLLRAFLLISGLVMLTTATWMLLFRLADTEPRARELAQLSASAVNVVRAALLTAKPSKRQVFLRDLSMREGIRILPAEKNDQIEPPPETRFFELVHQEMLSRLDDDTRIALQVNGSPGFWISFRLDPDDDEEYWLVLPQSRTRHGIPWHWLGWGMLALGLALVVAWLIVSRITSPLTKLAIAARHVGQGRQPGALEESGPEELIELTQAFNRMTRGLAQYERERAEVLAGISHDLRTPLARLRLEAEMNASTEAARIGMAADIDQMDAIITQFLDYARGDGGETPIECDVGELLAEVARHEQAIGRPLDFTPQTELPSLFLRRKAMRRAIQNLIDNAWKYGAPPISLAAVCDHKILEIRVEDCGPGIPAEEVEHLKQAFTRRETARSNVGGTGLGLAIVDRIVRLHGGTFDLLPRTGGGLLARFRLPLVTV